MQLVSDSRRPSGRTRRAIQNWPAAVCGLAFSSVVGCATATASREPLVSDRPDFTESTSTVGPGHVQAEGGYTFSRSAGERSSAVGEILVRVGLARFAELRLEPGSYSWVSSADGSQSGREDGELGAKFRLHNAADDNPSPVPAVSFILKSSIPTGAAVFREKRLQPEAGLATEWTLARHVGLGTNIDMARPVGDDGKRYTEYAVSASFGFDLSPRFGAFAEAYGFVPEHSGLKRAGYLDTGLTAALSADLQIDLRAGLGLNGTPPDYFVGAGIVRRW